MSVQTGAEGQYHAAAERRHEEEEHGYGWVVFAGVLLAVVGSLNSIYGIAAISDSKVFVNDAKYVFSSLNTWGWIMLCLGVGQLLVALGVAAKNQFSRWTGVFILGLNATAQMLFIPAYPFLAISLLAMDILAIYGLAAYGGRIARTR